MNSVQLIGRATRDPQSGSTGTGTAVASFTLAVDNMNDSASFINCVAYGKTAEAVTKFVRKGNLIGVSGRLNQRVYNKEDGTKVNIVEVVCESLDLLEKKPVEKPEEAKKPEKAKKSKK